MSGHFGTIVGVADFEYETWGGDYNLVAGDRPVVLCMVAYVLNENLFSTCAPFDYGEGSWGHRRRPSILAMTRSLSPTAHGPI